MGKNTANTPAVRMALRKTIISTLVAACFGTAFAEEATQLGAIEVKAAAESGYVVKSASAGTRTDTPVEHIPQSIVTVPRAMIEDQGSKTLSDALRNVSNVNAMDARDANNAVFKIRGFHSATVVDGVAMPGYFPNQESLVNAERIDVIKGPTGALFGSSQGIGSYGTLGGTIAITTAEPTQETIRRIGFKVGSYGEKGTHFDVNQPINEILAFRIAGEWSDSDSETDRVFFKRRALFPSIALTPNADTKVVVRLRYLENTTIDYSGLPVSGTLDTSSFHLSRRTNIAATGLPDTKNTSQGINLQWTQRLTDTWTFSLLTAYNEAKIDQRGTWVVDSTSGCFDFGNVTAAANMMCGARMWDHFKTTTISPSMTGKFVTGNAKHTLNLGVDYEVTKDEASMLYPNVYGPFTDGIISLANVSMINPVYPAWVDAPLPKTPYQQNRYKSKVAYLQDQIDIGALHLLGSLRYSRIDVTDVSTDPVMASLGFPLPNNHSSNSKLTPRLGAVYEFTPNFSAFVGYGEGIKVPTVSVFSAPPKPEESKQTEVGFRLKDLAGITATFALFDLTRKNVAIADPLLPGFSIQAGKQQSRGIDADIRWQATPSWSLLAAFTAQTAEITENTSAPATVGKQLFNVPQQTARLATRYDFRAGALAGLGLGLGLMHNSKLPGNSSNTFFTPATTTWDAQASYAIGKARFGLNIFNLTDKKYYVPSNYFGGNQVIPAMPRTITASANFSF